MILSIQGASRTYYKKCKNMQQDSLFCEVFEFLNLNL